MRPPRHFGACFWIVAVRAIFAGWLIALLVCWVLATESAKVSVIIITELTELAGSNPITAGSTTLLFSGREPADLFRNLPTSPVRAPRFWQRSWRPLVCSSFGPSPVVGGKG